MQAFFVELKDAAQTKAEGTATGTDLKVVHFDPSMMQGESEKVSSSLRTATAKNPVLRLTAERDAYRSTALLMRQDDAANSYEADKDAVILLDTELEEIRRCTLSPGLVPWCERSTTDRPSAPWRICRRG